MNDELRTFRLESRDPGLAAPVLRGVQAEGRLDGPLFELTLRQTYRNAGDIPLEVVYTFPLPAQAVLLGFASELNGSRRVGAVVAKAAAEARYESALAEGDAPVMLESLADGLHTANIGNLEPGDELVLEIRFAQLQAFEQGRLRLAIPTTIAPRYGNPFMAGLQPQQVPATSFLADYALALRITIAALRADASVDSPTHRFDRREVHDGLRLELAPGSRLDRDVVVLVGHREPQPSLVIQATDPVSHDAPVVALAALRLPPAPMRPRIALKLLVDCSGSMGGDSIASAREALHGALADLGEHDQLSLSRFGSTVEHVLAATACTPDALRTLRPIVDKIDATLGGTEMEAALQAVFELPMPRHDGGIDVLMLTDGEVWQTDAILAAARASGHRIFVIGVGTSPAEGVLRRLAEATGGACDFATPGEALAAAAARMLGRVRQQPLRRPRVDWGGAAAWQAPLGSAFGGDTVLALAGLRSPTTVPALRLLADDAAGAEIELARGEATAPCPGDTLARIAASRRLAGATEDEAKALAANYRLLGPYTNCILVHERDAADKTQEAARLHRVAAMLPAGWGATGRVAAGTPFSRPRMFCASGSPQSDFFGASTPPALSLRGRSANFGSTPPHALQIPAGGAEPSPVTLRDLAQRALKHLTRPDANGIEGIAALCDALPLHEDLRRAIDRVVALGLDADSAWVLLAQWVVVRDNAALAPLLAKALQPYVAGIDDRLAAPASNVCRQSLGGYGIDDGLAAQAGKIYRQVLGGYANDGWVLSRARRLQRALTGS